MSHPETTALFLSATGIPARATDGRLSPRAINLILTQIGRWHDAELKDADTPYFPTEAPRSAPHLRLSTGEGDGGGRL